MYDYFLGVDPGLDGALVLLSKERVILAVNKIPTLTLEHGQKKKKKRHIVIPDLLRIFENLPLGTFIVLEQVHAMPGQGVTSMFSMGYGLGVLTGLIACSKRPYQDVSPNTWKSNIMVGAPKGDKDASVMVALKLFPESQPLLISQRGKRDHNIADALLMAEWCRLQHTNV